MVYPSCMITGLITLVYQPPLPYSDSVNLNISPYTAPAVIHHGPSGVSSTHDHTSTIRSPNLRCILHLKPPKTELDPSDPHPGARSPSCVVPREIPFYGHHHIIPHVSRTQWLAAHPEPGNERERTDNWVSAPMQKPRLAKESLSHDLLLKHAFRIPWSLI